MILIFILISVSTAVTLTALMLRYQDGRAGWDAVLALWVAMMMSVLLLGIFVSLPFVTYDWFSAQHKAEILNKEYGTTYTTEDVFWASEVIDTIRHLDRKRIELNGNLMRKAD